MEKHSYAAAVNVFITVFKYANMWMSAWKSRQQQGVESVAEFEEPAGEPEELTAGSKNPKLPKYVVAAHTFLAANLQVAEKEKFRDEKYNSLTPYKVAVKLKLLLPAANMRSGSSTLSR